MNIQQAKEEIVKTIKAYTAKDASGIYRLPTVRQRPVLLMGPPGVGKTAIMEQAAKECGIGLVAYTMTHHTRQSAIGLPVISHKTFAGNDVTVTDYTMSEILASVYEQIEKTGIKEGILFLDELNCVSETLMPAMLQFLQYKTFGSHKLPEGWIVAAAGNPVRYNSSVRDLDTATLDRVKWIEVEADLDVWMNYARSKGVHPAILSFLRWKPEDFYAVETGVGGRHFVTARGWEDLSRMLLVMEEMDLEVTRDLPGQYLQHEEIAREFAIYYDLYCRCKDLPYTAMKDLSFDERLCILEIMLGRVYTAADRLKEEELLFESLSYFMDGMKRNYGETFSRAQIEEQLKSREKSMLVKKEYGILTPEEERREKLLSAEIERRVSDMGGSWSPMQMFAGRDEMRKAHETKLSEFGQMLSDYLTFTGECFDGKQESFLFALGILEHKTAVEFAKKTDPKLCEKIEERAKISRPNVG